MPPDIRRALELLAASVRQGRSADVLAYAVDPEVVAALVRAGLASEAVEHLAVTGGQPIEITRIRITDPGCQALAEHHKREDARVQITETGTWPSAPSGECVQMGYITTASPMSTSGLRKTASSSQSA
jgi:hypothetical protein